MRVRSATLQDALLIAKALLESSRSGKKIGFFDLVFDTREDAMLLAYLQHLCSTTTKSAYHVSNFIIASHQGMDLGVVCGYEGRIQPHQRLDKALKEMGFDQEYRERLAAYWLCEGEIDNQTWVIDGVMLLDASHGFESFKELIDKSLLTASLKGYHKIQTSIEIGDIEKEMFFTQMGFEPLDEKRSEYYLEQFGRAGLRRWRRLL